MAKSLPLSERAKPPEKRTPEPPPPFEDVLPSGLRVQWRMPDPFKIIAFDGVIPDPVTAAVIKLLTAERSYTPENDPRKLMHDAASLKGMYGVAAAMLVSPTLDLSREYGEGTVLGRREIGIRDVASLYTGFLVHSRIPAIELADPVLAEQLENAA